MIREAAYQYMPNESMQRQGFLNFMSKMMNGRDFLESSDKSVVGEEMPVKRAIWAICAKRNRRVFWALVLREKSCIAQLSGDARPDFLGRIGIHSLRTVAPAGSAQVGQKLKLTANEYVRLPVVVPSVAAMVMLNVPVCVGVPLNTPVLERVKPVGKRPLVTVY